MITSWMHLDERGGDPWVLPIWSAANQAVEDGRYDPLPDEVYRIGLHLTIRLNMLPRIVDRLNKDVVALLELVRSHGDEHVWTIEAEGFAFPIDSDVKYSVLAGVDSLLFELNSATELMRALFGELLAHVGNPVDESQRGREIARVIQSEGIDTGWYRSMDSHRNFFIHNGAPYIAIDLTNAPGEYGLIIMRENVRQFDAPESYLLLTELNNIVEGFVASKYCLQRYLISIFK